MQVLTVFFSIEEYEIIFNFIIFVPVVLSNSYIYISNTHYVHNSNWFFFSLNTPGTMGSGLGKGFTFHMMLGFLRIHSIIQTLT